MNLSNWTTTEFYNTTNLEDYPFSASVVIWIYNEYIFKEINFQCVVFLCVLSLIGIFGNFLVLYIYGFKFKKTNAHFFILSLAVLDTLCCIAMVLEAFDKRFPMYSGNYRILCKITRLAEMFSIVSSSMLLMCIALDRYYKLCKPFKSFTHRKARKAFIICITVAVILAWPMVLFHGPEATYTGVKNAYGYDCGDDDNFKGSVLPTIYFGFMGILNILVIIVLSIMYIRIFRAIFQWRKRNIGESILSSHVNVVSKGYRFRSSLSKLSISKHKEHNTTIGKHSSANNGISDYQAQNSRHDSIVSCTSNDRFYNVSGDASPTRSTLDTYTRTDTDLQQNTTDANHNQNKIHAKYISRRRISRKSKLATTNTIMFGVVTVMYILSYLPTIFTEILNASGLYIEEELPNRTRSILVIMNVTYFVNNICNQFIYSAINPAFRHEVKKIFTGS